MARPKKVTDEEFWGSQQAMEEKYMVQMMGPIILSALLCNPQTDLTTIDDNIEISLNYAKKFAEKVRF